MSYSYFQIFVVKTVAAKICCESKSTKQLQAFVDWAKGLTDLCSKETEKRLMDVWDRPDKVHKLPSFQSSLIEFRT